MNLQEQRRVNYLNIVIDDLKDKKKQRGYDKQLISIEIMKCRSEIKDIKFNAYKRDLNMPEL